MSRRLEDCLGSKRGVGDPVVTSRTTASSEKPPAPIRKLTKRGSRRRAQVLEAAGRLFAERGYHGTTVGDICAELGVGKGVFYWYFPSKEACFSEVLQSSLRKLRRAQHQAIENVPDPVERIEQGIRATVRFFRADVRFLALIRIAARYEEFATLVRNGQQVVVADVAMHLTDGMAAHRIRRGDPELMAHGILGALLHFVETYFHMDGEEVVIDRPQLADEAAAFCLTGVLR
jgi:TetR/AcrR family transcriptional regulator, cholesterol catabolism regulator